MRNFLIVLLLGLVAFATFMLFERSSVAIPPDKNHLPSDYNTGLTFEDAQKSYKPMVVEFYVGWCHTCRAFAPVFDGYRVKYGDKYNFVTVKTDSPENERVVNQFYIPGYPTVYLVFKNKKVRVDFEKYFDEQSFKSELDAFQKSIVPSPVPPPSSPEKPKKESGKHKAPLK
jgi:thioredoxin-like negative regulator of GroEL